ncbi:MAG: hypothetical protein HKN05_03450, partial [Rhizobiales bacterium]|nr:hypothetical protein [Hyphomicrobiales bacterium]
MRSTPSHYHQFPLLWMLLIGATVLATMVAVDQQYAAAMFAADRSYLCIVILIFFVFFSCHAGLHTRSVARELETAHGMANGRSAGTGEAGTASDLPRFRLQPRETIGPFMAEVRHATAGQANKESSIQQVIEIYADRLRSPVELGWFFVDILIRMGLIGTIVGFILIFASLSSGPKPDSGNIQELLISMSGGMGTALYTT